MSGASRLIKDTIGELIPWKWCDYNTLDVYERTLSDTQTRLKSAVQAAIKLFRDQKKDDVMLMASGENIPRAVFWFYGVDFRLNHRVSESLKAVNKAASVAPITSHVAAQLLERLNTDWTSYQNVLASYGKRVIEVYNINHTDNLMLDVTHCTWETLWTNRVWNGIDVPRRMGWEFRTLGKRPDAAPDVITLYDDSFTNVNASGDQLSLLCDSVTTHLAVASMTRSAVDDYYNCAHILETEWAQLRYQASRSLTATVVHKDAMYYKRIPPPRPYAGLPELFPVSEMLAYITTVEKDLVAVAVLADWSQRANALLSATKTHAEAKQLLVSDTPLPPSERGDRSMAFAVLSDYVSEYLEMKARAEDIWRYVGRVISPLGSNDVISAYDDLCLAAKKKYNQFHTDMSKLQHTVTEKQVLEWHQERQLRWNTTQRTFLAETWKIVGEVTRTMLARLESKDEQKSALGQFHADLSAIRSIAHPREAWFHAQFTNRSDMSMSGSHRSMLGRYTKTTILLNEHIRMYEATKNLEPLLVQFGFASNSLTDAAAFLDQARVYCESGFAADIKKYDAACLAARADQLDTNARLPRSVGSSLLSKFKTLSQHLRFNSVDLKEIRAFEVQFGSQRKESEALLQKITHELKDEKDPKLKRKIEFSAQWIPYVYLPPASGKITFASSSSGAAASASAAAAAAVGENDFKELEEANTFAQRKRDIQVLQEGVQYAKEIMEFREYSERLQTKDHSVEALFELISFLFSLKCAHLKVVQKWVK